MSTTIYYNQLQKLLFQYADLIEHSNSLGHSNEALNAENLFCEFLNKAFGWDLINANEDVKNQGIFDLIENKKGIIIQITSNKNYSVKLKNTLASLKKNPVKNKIKHLIILFISRKCPAKILKEVKCDGYVYECYDIPKLLRKIYYKNKLPNQFRDLCPILEQAIYPIRFNSTYPVMDNIDNLEKLTLQQVSINKKGIYIYRKTLIEDIFSFAQIANGLIVGGPGVGKSFTIEELQRYCNKKKIPCFIIRINELLDGTDDEIKKELKTNSNWINALKRVSYNSNDFKGLLIFDSFDSAKDERLKSVILKQIKDALKELNKNWNVLVTVRTFDASKSTRLRDLFKETNITNPVSCRHLEIPELTEAEFNLAVKKNEKLHFIVQKSTSELKILLKVPYFFKLLEKVIIHGNKFVTDNLIHIETEEQLLDIFWNTKIAKDTAKDTFLRLLTQQLTLNESLSCLKSKVITQFNSGIYDSLISTGVIIESSVTNQNISFSHNILLEFAVSKYLVPEDINDLVKYINKHQKIPFLFRQSFIYFYSKLWKQDKVMFWKHYFQIRNINAPVYRLYHQTILNYILAGYYKTVKDLKPVFDLTDTLEQSNTIKKFLEGIRFTSNDKLRDKDFLLFFAASQYMHENFLWELGFLINKALKEITKKPNKKFYAAISNASLNYLAFVLNERKSSSKKLMIELNGGHWGIQNVCTIFSGNKQIASRKIKEILEVLKEPEFPIQFFFTLSDNLLAIFKSDNKMGTLIYETLYSHVENSDKETFLGRSVIMNLRSNRRQDFESIHYKLESAFKEFIKIDPEIAIPLGLSIANQCNLNWSYYKPTHKPFELNINGIKARIFSDYYFSESKSDQEYGPLSHVENIFKYLEVLIADGDHYDAKKYINIILSNGEASIIWRRLIKFLFKYPAIFKKQIFSLLLNEGIFICDETAYEAGELVKVVWNYLLFNQKRTLESTIINLPKSTLLKERQELATRRIRRILSCIPRAELILPESTDFIMENDSVKNEPLVQYSGLVPNYLDEEKIRDMGVDVSNSNELTAYNLIKLIEPFNSKYDFNNSDRPLLSEYEPLIDTVVKLFHICKAQNSFNEKLLFNCDYEVSRFAKLVARNASKIKKSTWVLIENIAYFYIENSSYKSKVYQIGNPKKGFAYTPSPRTAAIQTFVQLLYYDKTGKVSPLVLRLMRDNMPIVRFKSINAINYYWHHQRADFWNILKNRSKNEKDGLCLHHLIRSICYEDILKENQDDVEKTALKLIISLKNSDNSEAHEIWHMYVILLLKLTLKCNSKVALEIINLNINIKEFSKQLLIEIIRRVIPPDQKNNYITDPNKYDILFDIIHAIAAYSFNNIASKNRKTDNLNDDFVIFDEIIKNLYFSLNYENKSTKDKESRILSNKGAFFNKIKPLLNYIVDESIKIDSGFMVAHTGYYFMQLLNSMIYADAEFVLTISASIVKCAAANGFTYDTSTLSEIVKFTEKILADHKELLSKKEHFDSLITILDLFADSGSQEALELTWRLKEVF